MSAITSHLIGCPKHCACNREVLAGTIVNPDCHRRATGGS